MCVTKFILCVLSQLTKYENKLLRYAGEIRGIMQHCSCVEHIKAGTSFILKVRGPNITGICVGNYSVCQSYKITKPHFMFIKPGFELTL